MNHRQDKIKEQRIHGRGRKHSTMADVTPYLQGLQDIRTGLNMQTDKNQIPIYSVYKTTLCE